MEKVLSFEEMDKLADRMEAADTCHNIVTQYAFEHSNGADKTRFFNKFWAKQADIVHVMPWGIETTREKNEYNNRDYDAIITPDEHDEIAEGGGLFVHTITTEVMEVAEDLQSVRACYLSPGHETSNWPIDMQYPEKGTTYSGEWAWSKYGWDFVKENGKWKIKNMRVYPVFKCDLNESWADAIALMPIIIKNATKDRSGPYLFQYSTDVIVPADEPEVPEPYKTLEDTGHTEIGCGYAAVEPVEVSD